MKKIISLLIFIATIVLLSGCGNNTETSTLSANTASVDPVITESPTDPFANNPTDSASDSQSNTITGPKEPILLLVEGNITKEQSRYYYYAYKVKNNSNQTITSITLYSVFFDEEGTIMYDSQLNSNVRVAPNQNIIIETLDKIEDISGLTAVIDKYSCKFGDNNRIEEYVDDSPEIVFP